jgi:hypothetical protein
LYIETLCKGDDLPHLCLRNVVVLLLAEHGGVVKPDILAFVFRRHPDVLSHKMGPAAEQQSPLRFAVTFNRMPRKVSMAPMSSDVRSALKSGPERCRVPDEKDA